MAKTSPVAYIRQVRNEMQKVTWPSKKEMIVSTTAVFIMVIIAAIFMYAADQFVSMAVRFILGLGG